MKRYNIDNLIQKKSMVNLIYGERSNGKSYQAKHKLMIEHFLRTGKKFILMRRWKDEITNNKINQYFSDIDIMKLTNNRYDTITMYQRELFFAKTNDNFRLERGEKIGYVFVLSQEQIYAGVSILDVDNIIFEEFFSRTMYLPAESDKIFNIYNTIDRKRNIVKLWLIGNTISRTNPVLRDWNLFETIVHQQQGSIITINKTMRGIEFSISLEYCESTGQYGIVLGQNEKMINTGSWQTTAEPHLYMSYKQYKCIFRMVFVFKKFQFLVELLINKQNSNICWFVRPKYSAIKKNTLVITDNPSESPYFQSNVYDIKYFKKMSEFIKKTFVESNIFFCSDLCGNEFKSVINFQIKK